MSPDATAIVYSSPKTGSGDLYVVSRDGSNTARLTEDPEYEGDATYSPDGSKIAFVREQDDVGKIWIMDPDGANQVRLTKGAGYDCGPSFSPDGSKIVFTRFLKETSFFGSMVASAEIYVINTDGTGETRITHNDHADWEASFSPVEPAILYSTGEREIYVMDENGSNARRLTRGSSPSYSPDGKRIVFIDDSHEKYQYDIYVIDAAGGSRSRLTTTGGYKSGVSFCPDGQGILFLDEPKAKGVGTICIVDVGDGSVERIASTE